MTAHWGIEDPATIDGKDAHEPADQAEGNRRA